ncbi:unnamed protein product, partial [Owenia fusiformis]
VEMSEVGPNMDHSRGLFERLRQKLSYNSTGKGPPRYTDSPTAPRIEHHHVDDLDLEALITEMHTSFPDEDERLVNFDQESISGVSAKGINDLVTELNVENENIESHDLRQDGAKPVGIEVRELCRVGDISRESMSLPLDTCIPAMSGTNLLQNPLISAISNGTKSSPSSPMLRRTPRQDSDETHIAVDFTSGHMSCIPTETVSFFRDDKSPTELCINQHRKALDLCHLLTLKTHVKEDKNWVIVEHLGKHNIERNLEDHENVLKVYSSWKDYSHNKFYFRKDLRKYEVFQNPEQFFPSSMLKCDSLEEVGDSQNLDIQVQRAKHILLQNLFSTMDNLPDIQGCLLLREKSKRSWKKTFFILNNSGLFYSSKGSSKDPKHLLQFADLSECEVYTCCHPKKNLHSPTDYCLALKSNCDSKDLRVLCANDERTRQCWIAGLRLRKYGTVLRDNYHAAQRRQEKLKNATKGTSAIKSASPSLMKSRVAMDFTGHEGRIVNDPNEALGVAVQEGQKWRKRNWQVVAPTKNSPPKTGLGAGIHMTQPWFHSGINRQEASDLIVKQGLVDGVFLVRESRRTPGMFVISFSHNHKIKHTKILQVEEEGQILYSVDNGVTKFSDLIQLVDFYHINAMGLPTKLLHYVT